MLREMRIPMDKFEHLSPYLEEILPDCFLSSETATFHSALAPKECKIFIFSVQGLLA